MGILTGKVEDRYHLRERVWAVLPPIFFRFLREDFLLKSLGNQGRDGNQWKELSPKTLKRRRGKGIRKIEPHERARLKRDKAKSIYESSIRQGFTHEMAQANAERGAASYMRGQVYKDTDNLILIDHGNLLDACSPGQYSPDGYRPNSDGQMVKVDGNSLIIEINPQDEKRGGRLYADYHQQQAHKPENLVARRFLPEVDGENKIPQDVMDEMYQALSERIAEAVAETVEAHFT
jgi:hypothetical protein